MAGHWHLTADIFHQGEAIASMAHLRVEHDGRVGALNDTTDSAFDGSWLLTMYPQTGEELLDDAAMFARIGAPASMTACRADPVCQPVSGQVEAVDATGCRFQLVLRLDQGGGNTLDYHLRFNVSVDGTTLEGWAALRNDVRWAFAGVRHPEPVP